MFIVSCYCYDIDNYIRVPGGLMMHKDCIHNVRSGSHIIDNENDGVYLNDIKIPSCKHKPIFNSDLGIHKEQSSSLPANGWQTWTSYQHPNNSTFTVFNGNFSVPAAPLDWGNTPKAAIVYIFTGLQNENWIPNSGGLPIGASKDFEIIQPVLQYGGGSYNGGGEYWGVASWYVTVDAGAFYSDEVVVNPGDSIYGVMESEGPLTWRIDSITPSGQNSSLTVTRPRLKNNPWAYCTLEVYNVQQCSWLPPSNSVSHFTNMILRDSTTSITPQWDVFTEDYLGGPSQNPCGSLFTVIDPTAVDLTCQS